MRKRYGVKGSQENKPSELFVCVDTIYLRENIKRINENGFNSWQYDEIVYSTNEYLHVLIEKINEMEKIQADLLEKIN